MSVQHGLGAAPPLSAVTDDNQAGSLWIVTILATIYVVLSAAVRGFVKWGLYGADDYLLAIATVSQDTTAACSSAHSTTCRLCA